MESTGDGAAVVVSNSVLLFLFAVAFWGMLVLLVWPSLFFLLPLSSILLFWLSSKVSMLSLFVSTIVNKFERE